jgi:hypothetical protein
MGAIEDQKQDARQRAETEQKTAAVTTPPEPECDRRGVALPARQRVGGIITPQ